MTIKLYCWVEFGRGDYGEREDELFDISDQEFRFRITDDWLKSI